MVRFRKIYRQEDQYDFHKVIEIWVDVETGVHYLWRSMYDGGAGLTPLLDENGEPVVNKNMSFLHSCEDRSWTYIK